ncbi:hypothetical protein [Arthrobacter sp. zg-Y769]|uniref:hypothetical protein n=1 Tax=Arthrobacter sp. zg-Y769 TaxID=2894191 RepID=UPI001E3E1C1B|nr:hypothetical protein [Arthrobacter sp. zg-Y769]MCC9205180.1 hypothetical protein [Arthrobacter sp. zg-Y769]
MPQRSPGLRNPRSAWLVIGLAAGLLWVAALQGSLGVIVWMLATGSLLVLTALYALGFRRRSWAGLDTLEQRKFALSLGAVVLVVGMVAGVVSTPDPVPGSVSEDAAGLEPRPDLFAFPTTTPPPGSVLRQALPPDVEDSVEEAEPDMFAVLGDTSNEEPADEASIADAVCGTPGQSRVQRQIEYRCTHNSAGDLVWMESGMADQLAEERAAAVQQAETARRAEEERARQAYAEWEQEMAQRRAAEERAREDAQAPPPPNPANPPGNQPQPPPIEPPGKPPVEPPPGPGEPPAEPPPEPAQPPSEPPTSPPSPDPTAPPSVPPTPPGPTDPPDPGTPEPDIPILPPEFPVPPNPPSPPRPTPPSSFAPPSVAPEATEAAVEAGLPADR